MKSVPRIKWEGENFMNDKNQLNDKKKIIIACGGTGGHFYPGYAIGKELIKKGFEVLFVIKKTKTAQEKLEQEGLKYTEISLVGLPREFDLRRYIKFLTKLISSIKVAKNLVDDYKPDAVLSMGGYVAFPLVFWAKIKKIAIYIHEANSKIGLVNKISLKYAKMLFLGLPIADKIENAELVGTPIRKEFCEIAEKKVPKKALVNKTVLIFGGSQGASAVNNAMIHIVKEQKLKNTRFIHITGEFGYRDIKREYINSKRVEVLEYVENIHEYMAKADLVVCRAGASTVSELIALRKPAILVPYPHATNNHQFENAKVIASFGCARVVVQNDQLEENIYDVLKDLIYKENLFNMGQNYNNLLLPQPCKSARKVAEYIASDFS